MNYFKLVAGEVVLGVTTEPVWVHETRAGYARCDAASAQGIVSPDEEEIYQLANAKKMAGDLTEIEAVSITETEYNTLAEILNLGGEVTADQITWPEEEVAEEQQDDLTLAEVRERKLAALRADCHKAICSGVDVVLSDGQHHFDFTVEDQINLDAALVDAAQNGTGMYHASGELYREFARADLTAVREAALQHKQKHLLYFNSLKNWVNHISILEELCEIFYGSEIPNEFCSEAYLGMRG